jgi:hypothetical protein
VNVSDEWSTMRRGLSAVYAVVAMCLTGCGAVGGEVHVEGPAPTRVPWSGPVYMEDFTSTPREHPEMVDLTGSTTLTRLTWRGWGSPRAVADGYVFDLACLSGCPGDDPASFPAHLVLSGLVKRQYAAYYRHAVLTPVGRPAPDWAVDIGPVDLHVPQA